MNVSRWKALLLTASGVLAVILIVAVIVPDRPESASDLARTAGLKAAEALGQKIHLTDPAQAWDLWLGACRTSDETKRATCTEVKILYRSSAQGELVMTSERAEADTERWEIDLSGDVTVTSGELSLRTPTAHYSSQAHRITSDDSVIIEGRGLEVRGTGLDVDVASQAMRLTSAVYTRIEPNARVGASAAAPAAGDSTSERRKPGPRAPGALRKGRG